MSQPYTFRPSKLYIRSDDCRGAGLVATPSNFRFVTPEDIQGAKGVCLLQARIPNTFASLPPYQRWVGYVVTEPTGAKHYRVFQINGDTFMYNYGTFVNQLNADATQWWEVLLDGVKMSTVAFKSLAVTHVPDLEFAVDTDTRKVTITNISTEGAVQMMDINTLAQCVIENELVKPWLYGNQIIGLNVNVLSPSIAMNDTYECPYPADLCRTDSINIQTNLFLNGVQTSGGVRNILESVAVNVPPLGVINYEAKVQHYIGNIPPNISEIQFRLLDENGIELTDMSLNSNVELVLGFIY